ncbi:TlpA family protein disulfide reductase [Chelativorans intermedius]|uniref:TlpA family protein disulfide reductase n=1 Tax=Chelativorans intermedius TaxID=515947 RepID=A0ABV6DBF5_9HYPH|nr:TlpA disulfide reductase family protein [Chelativorans intermedius]MCT9000284.1 TlpA family protein disulfide reductase [Chelativorans intermedius]
MRTTVLGIRWPAALLFVVGAAALAGAGLYATFSDAPVSEPATTGRDATATAQDQGNTGSFAFHDEPQSVPALSFVDGDGSDITLADFRGRTILLNIWATWCVPCREEMPSLDRLQAKLGGPDFQVVPLSIDRGGLPAVEAFYEELGLSELGIYVDESGRASRELGALGIPTTLLLDHEGRELGRLVGPAEWDSPDMVALLRRKLPSATAATQADAISAESPGSNGAKGYE